MAKHPLAGHEELIVSRVANGFIVRRVDPFSDKCSRLSSTLVASTPAELAQIVEGWGTASSQQTGRDSFPLE